MRLFTVFLSLLILAFSCKKKQAFDADYLFTNVSIIKLNDEDFLKRKNILVKDGKIIDITDSLPNLKIKNIIDLKGKFLLPALADAHVHLPKNESDLEKFFILNLINGVTKLRSMRGDWKHLEWREKYNSKGSIYPKLYLSAPPISWRNDFTTSQIERFVNKAKPFDFIKILSIKDETLFRMLDSLCKLNNISIGGHYPQNISDNEFFSSNYTSIEHLGGLVEQPELLNYRIQEIKKRNIFLCPTLSWYNVGSGRYSFEELRNQPAMQYISTKVMDDWIEKTKQYRAKMGQEAYLSEVSAELKKLDIKYGIINELNKHGVKMLLSPDSSSKYMISGFGILEEMKLLKKANLTNLEIIKMATINFSEFYNGNFGIIERGKDADFIVLSENPIHNLSVLERVEGVFVNEKFIDHDDLIRLSKSILPK